MYKKRANPESYLDQLNATRQNQKILFFILLLLIWKLLPVESAGLASITRHDFNSQVIYCCKKFTPFCSFQKKGFQMQIDESAGFCYIT